MTNLELYKKWVDDGGETHADGFITPITIFNLLPDIELLEARIESGMCDLLDLDTPDWRREW